MARSIKYDNEVKNAINRINYRLKGIESMLGVNSEQYERYVNSITASLPTGSYNLSLDGHITIANTKENRSKITLTQLQGGGRKGSGIKSSGEVQRGPANLPTVNESIKKQKKEMQRTAEAPEEISDEEALQELNAKTFVKNREDTKHKLKYTAEAKADMEQKGKKSYQQLKEILEKGENEKREKKRAKDRAASKRYYEKHRAEILERRRAKRAAARAGR